VNRAKQLLPLLGATALVILLHQAMDLGAALADSDLAMPAGRLRPLFTLESRTLTLLSADLLLLTSLLLRRRWSTVGVLGSLHWLAALALLAAVPLLLRDAGAVSVGLSGGALLSLRITVLRLVALLPGLAVLSALAGQALRRASKETTGS
jgi:hypothetical protein